MSTREPPRLTADDELGAALRSGDQAQLSGLTEERLAAGAGALEQAIARGAPPTPLPVWKIGVPLAILAAALGGYYLGRRGEAPAVERTAEPSPVVATGEADAGAVAAPPDAAVVAPPETPEAASDPEEAPRPARPARREQPREQPAPAPDIHIDAIESDLPEQIRLYDEAREAGARREYAGALDRLDELLRQFPNTPLRADAELTRADLLTRAGRLDDASRSLSRLAADRSHRGRRGELLRALGDVHRKRNDCAQARAAYRRALGEKLSRRERGKVERGLERCPAAR